MVVFGQQYEQDIYAQERYGKLQTIGMEILALADGVDVAELEPLRSTVLSRPTPFAVADCAVFDENGRFLTQPLNFSDCKSVPRIILSGRSGATEV